MESQDWTVEELVEDYKAGNVNRRQFVNILTGVGISIGVASALLTACGSDTKTTGGTSAVSTPGAGVATTAPQAVTGFKPMKRGGGGQLKVFWWQAPSILNPHLSSGTKDRDGSRIFYEALIAYDQEGNLVPTLAAEAPSKANNGVSADLKTVTFKLKQNVKWHDGKPFTADDVVFTWQYAVDPGTAALTVGDFKNVQNVEKVDNFTVKVTLKEPTLDWSSPWSSSAGLILPKHVFEPFKGGTARDAPANLKPVGTGPYKITDFRPNDLVLADINADYHMENRPFFDKLEMKGGGDAVGAARAVLQTGEYDFGWNLQVDGPQLTAMEKGGAGVLLINAGGSLEHVTLNYTDPNVEVDGEKSSLKAPHPFFTDLKVRQAFNLAMDRQTIVEQLYGKTGEVALVFAYTPSRYVPAGLSFKKDAAKANQLLDEAGWVKGSDGVRAKGGKRMKVLYQTSVNKLRQDTQAVIKKDLEGIGVEVELKAVIADVFFGADPANPDNFPHFYADMQMYTTTRGGPDDLGVFLLQYLSTEVKQKANNWSPANSTRYVSKDFDALYNQAVKETDPTKAADLFKKANQKLIDDVAMIPLVARPNVNAAKKNIKDANLSGWASALWNLPYWHREG